MQAQGRRGLLTVARGERESVTDTRGGDRREQAAEDTEAGGSGRRGLAGEVRCREVRYKARKASEGQEGPRS